MRGLRLRPRLSVLDAMLVPAWLLPGTPKAQFDFADSRAWLNGAAYYDEAAIKALFSTFSTPAHVATGSDGNLYSIPANSLDCFNMPAGVCRGQLIEEARTNKIDHYNLSPTDLTGLQDGTNSPIAAGYVSVVDDSVALAAIVNSGNGKAYKIAIPSGAATGLYVVRGTTATLGNTNTHISSVFMRGNGASASPWIDNSVASSYAATTSQYVRIDRTISTATVNPSTMAAAHWKLEISHVTGTASEVYFILAGLEEGSFATSPIVTAGSSVTRAASSIVASDGSAVATAAQQAKAMFFNVEGGEGVNSSATMLGFGGGALLDWINTIAPRAVASGNIAQVNLGSGSYSVEANVAYAMDATSFTVKGNGSAVDTEANAWGQNTGNAYFGTRAAGDRALNGYLGQAAFSTTKSVFDPLAVAP